MDLLGWMRTDARFNDFCFVFLCSELEPAAFEKEKELCTDEILVKPFSHELLRDVVGGIVQRGKTLAAGRA